MEGHSAALPYAAIHRALEVMDPARFAPREIARGAGVVRGVARARAVRRPASVVYDPFVQLKLLVLPLLLAACDSGKPAEAKRTADKPAPKAESASRPAEPPAAPKPLPPAPEGSVVVGRVYVDTCAADGACPTLLQDAGAKHCAARKTAGASWRLPTLAELESWKGNAELTGYDVFHWSGSTWAEDAAQFWIYDPGSDMKTTAKPDRKPFTIRCVQAPDA